MKHKKAPCPSINPHFTLHTFYLNHYYWVCHVTSISYLNHFVYRSVVFFITELASLCTSLCSEALCFNPVRLKHKFFSLSFCLRSDTHYTVLHLLDSYPPSRNRYCCRFFVLSLLYGKHYPVSGFFFTIILLLLFLYLNSVKILKYIKFTYVQTNKR